MPVGVEKSCSHLSIKAVRVGGVPVAVM